MPLPRNGANPDKFEEWVFLLHDLRRFLGHEGIENSA